MSVAHWFFLLLSPKPRSFTGVCGGWSCFNPPVSSSTEILLWIATKIISSRSPIFSDMKPLYRGDFLRNLPFVTVWHWKIKFQMLWDRAKNDFTYSSTYPKDNKNIIGPPPRSLMNQHFSLNFQVCHTVTLDKKWFEKLLKSGKFVHKCINYRAGTLKCPITMSQFM